MELGERVAAVEAQQAIHRDEIGRLRDSSERVWKAMGATDQRLSTVIEKVDGLTGTLHLVAENAASVAINRYRTENEPPKGRLDDILTPGLVKIALGLVGIVGTLLALIQAGKL